MPRRRQMTIKLFFMVSAVLLIFCTLVYYVTADYLSRSTLSLSYSQLRTLALQMFFAMAFFLIIYILEEEALDARRHILLGRPLVEKSTWVEAAAANIKNIDEINNVIDDFLMLLEKAYDVSRAGFEPDDTVEGALRLSGTWFWGDRCLENLQGGLEKYVAESFGKEMLPQLRERLEPTGRRTLAAILNDLLRFSEHKLHYDKHMEKLGEISRRIKFKKPRISEEDTE